MDQILSKYKKLQSSVVSVELEFRMRIPPPIKFKTDIKRTITYYRCSIYPSLVFRSSLDYHIQTKEQVEKLKYKNGNLVLSVEQTYTPSDFKLPIIKINSRTICRQIISTDPLVEIIKYKNEYTLEIEFNLSNYKKVDNIIKNYSCIYYPSIKPKEISSVALARKLLLYNYNIDSKYNNVDSKYNAWIITPKADGIHVIVIEGEKSRILLFDNGTIRSINNKANRKMILPINVFEAELMSNSSLLYYDCLIYNSKSIANKPYLDRLDYCRKDKKKILKETFKYSIPFEFPKTNYEIDGFIILNNYNRNHVYKSKFKNTVDLRYKNGYLLLENEEISNRIPKDTNYLYENNEIYEFYSDLSLLRKRDDKIIANYKFPYDDNPLFKIINCIGIPTLRYLHNKIKLDLLSLLPKSVLLDIGSAKGGDMNKWIDLGFNKVYAVDPLINFRSHNKKIIEIKDNVQNLPSNLHYDCLSLFFVPWHNSFLPAILKAKNIVIAIMDNPISYSNDVFECSVNNTKNLVSLKIKETETAQNIIEPLTDYTKIFTILENNNYLIHSYKCDMLNILFKEESLLFSMYLYYEICRN